MAEFEDAEEEISNEEKLQIAQHFLLSSPPGQFSEVLTDVRKIIPEDLLSDALASGIARVSNLKNSKVVDSPSGKKVILSKASEIDATHYLDPNDSSVFLVDHLNLKTAEDSTAAPPSDENLEAPRAALQVAIGSYITKSFPSKDSACGVFAKDGKIFIVITGEKTNLKNFWSGKWNSNWNITISDGEAQIEGEIKLHVHYFEDGNLQLQSGKTVSPTSLKFSSDDELSAAVVKFIESQEVVYQSGLEDMYSTMNNETFRSMRRIMPVTRTKMEWNVNAVRMIRQTRK